MSNEKRTGIATVGESGVLMLGDPCYTLHGETAKNSLGIEDQSDLGSLIAKMGEGTPYIEDGAAMLFLVRPDAAWIVRAEISDEGAWGHRVARLRMTAEIQTAGVTRKEIGVADVDAGLMMFSDPLKTMFNPDPDTFAEDWGAFCDILNAHDEKHGHPTFFQAGEGAAVITSSGMGDGVYPVTVEIGDDGFVQAVEIDFLPEEEDWED